MMLQNTPHKDLPQGYVHNVYNIPALVDSLVLNAEGRTVFLDTSIFDPPIGYLREHPPERRDSTSLARLAQFYERLTPVLKKSNILLHRGIKHELLPLLLYARLALEGDTSESAQELGNALFLLHKGVAVKKGYDGKDNHKILKATLKDIQDLARAGRIEKFHALCSLVDRYGVSSVLEIALTGTQVALASRDRDQIDLLKELVNGRNFPISLIRYNSETQLYELSSAAGTQLDISG